MILERFERGGLTAAMTTPSSSQTRQLPRRRSQAPLREESSSELEEEVHNATYYIMPRVDGALEVKIPKRGKFLVPIPQIDS